MQPKKKQNNPVVDSVLSKGYTDTRRVKLVVSHDQNAFREVRCSNCHALLYKVLRKSHDGDLVEIKCRRCGTVQRN